jgi:hypothetical protein
MVYEFFVKGANKDDSSDKTPKFKISIFPCGNEVIEIEGEESYSIELDMDDPLPDATVIDMTELLISNRTNCPVTGFAIKMSNDTPAAADEPTADQLRVFSIDGDSLSISPVIAGNYTFYVQGTSDEGVHANIEYKVVVFPCKPSIATITASSFSSVRYYQGASDDGSMVFINLTEANVELEDKDEEEFDIVLPLFENNDDTLCPLSYRLSSSNEDHAAYTNLDAPVAGTDVSIKVPVTHGEPDEYTFYLEAYNKDDANTFTPKVVVTLHACGNEVISSTLTEI